MHTSKPRPSPNRFTIIALFNRQQISKPHLGEREKSKGHPTSQNPAGRCLCSPWTPFSDMNGKRESGLQKWRCANWENQLLFTHAAQMSSNQHVLRGHNFFFFFFPLVWFSGHLWQIMCDQNKLVGESWRHLFSVKHLSKWFPTDDEKEIWMHCLLVTIIQKGYCKDNSLHNLDRIFLHLFFLSKGVVKIYLQEWKWENFRKIRTFRWSDLHKYI